MRIDDDEALELASMTAGPVWDELSEQHREMAARLLRDRLLHGSVVRLLLSIPRERLVEFAPLLGRAVLGQTTPEDDAMIEALSPRGIRDSLSQH